MYVGRIVCVGRTTGGELAVAYRISSRSFPNRHARQYGESFHIEPFAGSPDATSASPYIAYECLTWNERYAVVSNGTHTRPIFERLKAGNTVRDAIVSVLNGLDREFDEHDTPRICGLIDLEDRSLWLGSITADSISVRPVEVAAGECQYISTYGFPLPDTTQIDRDFDPTDASGICQHVMTRSLFGDFDLPVCSVAAISSPLGILARSFNP